MTIDQTVQVISLLLFLGLGLAVFVGWRQISSASKLPYFLLRRERMSIGWRWLIFGLILGIAAFVSLFSGRRIAYRIIPPSPSITPSSTTTLTMTITSTATITSTPTISLTPTITPTPTETGIPVLPDAITVLIRETVTPRPDAVFSPIEVATRLDTLNRPVNAAETFENPVRRLFGAFTYENLSDGVRWTAIWYRGDEVVCLESDPWTIGTGGSGYTVCEPEIWFPGEYEIQMFVGEVWLVSKSFTIVGDPPEPTLSPTPSPTVALTPST